MKTKYILMLTVIAGALISFSKTPLTANTKSAKTPCPGTGIVCAVSGTTIYFKSDSARIGL